MNHPSTNPSDTNPSNTNDRELTVSRVIHGSPALVFSAFTQVQHLSQWWGPHGFTTTTAAFEFRVDGVWEFVMHAPDGTDYPEWITWTEIDPPHRIAMLHGERRDDPEAFTSILTFTAQGEHTEVELRTVFPTAALRDRAVAVSGAVEGGNQTLDNLDTYVTHLGNDER